MEQHYGRSTEYNSPGGIMDGGRSSGLYQLQYYTDSVITTNPVPFGSGMSLILKPLPSSGNGISDTSYWD